MFDDFIRQCADDCVNAREFKLCPTCDETIPSDQAECVECQERRETREACNDAGID